MKKVSIFGSTGCVGKKMFDAVAGSSGAFEVVCLAARSNYKELVKQAMISRPQYISVEAKFVDAAKELLKGTNTTVLPNEEIKNLAQLEVDILGMAISGISGLIPSFHCLGHAATIALATKEVAVCGGQFFVNQAHEKNTRIIPVDSEHSAIYRCLENKDKNCINKIILTCSGGPFINYSREQLETVTVQDSLNHPTWQMGGKITIDSATLINKALEIIEAAFLFDIEIEKVEAIIHKESMVHGMVQLGDSSIMALMGTPDMRIPINYAFAKYSEKDFKSDFKLESLSLSFQKFSDWQKENVELAYEAYNEKKCIAFSVADEMAVQEFLDNKIRFKDIPAFVRGKLKMSNSEKVSSISDIIEICNGVLSLGKNR
ncbi:MAG: 1-deoxy-D-xylulose-5-phosphate reductoisomerase [Holosporales bacterium]|jgi:1-deoxy-D-xylulose-5-phosphate reductoisomerase|nr:1-deoxy-D-xylulose-5-phosphate reductoisomerase [Holosporales bacterium]